MDIIKSHFFLVLFLMLGWGVSSEGRQFNYLESDANISQSTSLFDIGDILVEETLTYRISHDPGGPTLNHDYYDPSVAELLHLVEIAHTNKIAVEQTSWVALA